MESVKTSTNYRTLANISIRNLTPYQPGKPIEELERELGITDAIKLASNENPLGPSPHALSAIHTILTKSHFYPDGGCYELRSTLAQQLQIDPTQLTFGNGSENVLELIAKAYLSATTSAVISQYAFLTIPLLIKSYGAELVTVPAVNFAHDISGMIDAVTDKTRILFIVNPNNPTGTYTTNAELTHLLDSLPTDVIVVIDEAYNEYIDRADYPNSLPLLKNYPNVIITRTFSKIYGLASLRLGFAISSPEIADILNRARLPFNVNSLAAKAGAAALTDHEHIQKSVLLNHKGMQQLEAGLQEMQASYIPSVGNFISINVKQNAGEIYQKLLLQGVIVRPLMAYDMATYIRVTVGTEEQNARFLKALATVLI